MANRDVRTLILCGGKGTRAYPHTVEVPKPLLEVAGRPVLAHVMEIYARQGFCDFVLAAGYKREQIADFASTCAPEWTVDVVDTGEDTNTGGRVIACRDVVPETFFVTYADGLGDVDLAALLAYHRDHDGFGTLTSVPLPSQYGTVEFGPAGRIERFREKPHLPDHWINAGFFVFDTEAFDHWAGDDLENDVLPALAAENRLYAFQHSGFWKSMDTYKDSVDLTRLAEGKETAPWVPSTARPSC